ncbi:MAG TPA: LLM class flavin-dependent oxidoreductase, partial [Dehalococcoidia bacterium]|nr:LLM class flavin-dependent oxidoreductase [Dehalococcoidia bacterium]
MKFGLFFVMQRPDDVTERDIYDTEIPQMIAADALGYDSIWIAEHHFSTYGICSAPQVLAGVVAGATKRLRVGMGITLLPLHDPVQIAEELAVLDQASGGRLEVGIGRASTPLEYSGYSIPYEESRARVDENLEILRGVWTNDRFNYHGRFRQVHDVMVLPKPRQQPYPPLYLACNSADTVPIAARQGLPMMTSFLVLDSALIERHEVYRRVSADHGYPTDEVEARIAQTWNIRFVYVADDERAAIEDPREHVLGYYGAAGGRPKAPHLPRPEISYEDRLKSGAAFFGTPDQVVDQIGRFHETTGIHNVLCFMSVRAMDSAKVLRSMELFAAKVMPQLPGPASQVPSPQTQSVGGG